MLAMNAWLLDFGDNCMAAVGTRELLHLVDAPVTFPVPYTPAYCRRVVSWQERLLPVMDIATRLGTLPRNAPFLAVVGYQQQRGEHPQFGALKLASPPRQLAVDDAQACALPEENGAWRELAISCFEHLGTPVPVLDLRRIFGNAPRAHCPIETGAAPSAHDTANEES
jgi:chemotaxis signal transduction protein